MAKNKKSQKKKKDKDKADKKSKAQQRLATTSHADQSTAVVNNAAAVAEPSGLQASKTSSSSFPKLKWSPIGYFFRNEVRYMLKWASLPPPAWTAMLVDETEEEADSASLLTALRQLAQFVLKYVQMGEPLHATTRLLSTLRACLLQANAADEGGSSSSSAAAATTTLPPPSKRELEKVVREAIWAVLGREKDLSAELFDGRLLGNLPLITDDLLRPMATLTLFTVQNRLMGLPDLMIKDDEEEEEKAEAEAEAEADQKEAAVIEDGRADKEEAEKKTDADKETKEEEEEETKKDGNGSGYADKICADKQPHDQNDQVTSSLLPPTFNITTAKPITITTIPALFVMLTTLEQSDDPKRKAVAVFAGRCEPNWSAYLLGLVPNVNLKGGTGSGTTGDNQQQFWLKSSTSSPLNQLNTAAVNAFFNSMAQVYTQSVGPAFYDFIAEAVKVIVHDELLEPAACAITSSFNQASKDCNSADLPPMLRLRGLAPLVRPLVTAFTKRYYNNRGDQKPKATTGNLPGGGHSSPEHSSFEIPWEVRLLLDAVVPFFLAQNGLNRSRSKADRATSVSADLSSSESLKEKEDKDEEDYQQLPMPPMGPLKSGSAELRLVEGSFGGNVGAGQKRGMVSEEHLVEWIIFTAAYLERIKGYVLEQVEKWERANADDNSGGKDDGNIGKDKKKSRKGGKNKQVPKETVESDEAGKADQQTKNGEKKENSSSNHQLVSMLLMKLGTTDRIRQFLSTAESALDRAKHELAPLFELHALLHGQGLAGLKVSTFVGSTLQQLKLKCQSPKTKPSSSSSWAFQLFDELQKAVTAEPSFAHFRQTLKQLKREHDAKEEQEQQEQQEIIEKEGEKEEGNSSENSSSSLKDPSTQTAEPPLHELLETLPLVAFDLSHLPAFFRMELAELAAIDRGTAECRGLPGYANVVSVLYYNKQQQPPLEVLLPSDHLFHARQKLKKVMKLTKNFCSPFARYSGRNTFDDEEEEKKDDTSAPPNRRPNEANHDDEEEYEETLKVRLAFAATMSNFLRVYHSSTSRS